MPSPFSNALINMVLQEQDLVSPGNPSPIIRAVPQLIVPCSNLLTYSGFVTVTNVNFTVASGTASNPILFFFVRNTQTSSGGLNVTISPPTGSSYVENLTGGSIFMFANPSNPYGANNTTLGAILIVMVTPTGSSTVAEYMVGF